MTLNHTVFGQISVDAGLTPPEDRWIFRLQTRLMQKSSSVEHASGEMKTNTVNSVLAYGFRSNITFIIKTMYLSREMVMNSTNTQKEGIAPFTLLTKYGFYRFNDRDITFGAAGTFAITLPTGSKEVSLNNWDIEAGLLFSFRHLRSAFHLNASYRFNDVAAKQNELTLGNEFSINFSYTRQFPIGSSSELTIAPVLEINYSNKFADINQNDINLENGESVLFVAPGIKITRSSFIFESLYQIPVYENLGTASMSWDTKALVGIRYMF